MDGEAEAQEKESQQGQGWSDLQASDSSSAPCCRLALEAWPGAEGTLGGVGVRPGASDHGHLGAAVGPSFQGGWKWGRGGVGRRGGGGWRRGLNGIQDFQPVWSQEKPKIRMQDEPSGHLFPYHRK